MKKAFTMVELLVVIGIIGILMAVLIGTFGGSTDSARASKCLANMRNLAMAVQATAMGSATATTHHYPFAGSFKQYKGLGRDRTEVETQGWIGWTNGGGYSPDSAEDSWHCITNGSIWKAMKGARDCYVCPAHIKANTKEGKLLPAWSYAMNAYFGWASKSTPRAQSYTGKSFPQRRADRILLLAELDMENSSDEKQTDPILQYSGCEGDGDESIGFTHTSGKYKIANVCFADGHVEKIRQPVSGDTKELTKWLCRPWDDDGDDFDIRFDGKEYKKVQ